MRVRRVAGGLVVAYGLACVAALRQGQRSVNMIRAAGEQMQADVREIREHAAEVERILTAAGVPRSEWRPEWLLPARIRARAALPVSPRNPR